MSLDLRTGQSVWHIKKQKKINRTPLPKDINSDIVVVGAGIAGALISYRLVNSGQKVILVDARGIALGSTAASTAILSYETDIHLYELIKIIGEKQAVRVYQAGIEAIDYIGKVIAKLDNNCDFKKRDSIYFASSKRDINKIEKEYFTRKKYGFDLRLLGADEFQKKFSFAAPCALLTTNNAEVNPVKLTEELIRVSKEKGLKVFTNTKIKKYNPHKTEPSAITQNGFKIKAKHFIFATGYETEQFLKQKEVKLISTYAIVSEPVDSYPGLYKRSMIWESRRPYIYIRTTNDNRIIVGGEDVDFVDSKKRDQLIPIKSKILEKKFKKMFPKIPFEIFSAWAGTFAESKDSLPFIGAHKDYPGAYFSLGYGGNGTTFAIIASLIISDLISGKNNPDAQIFSFER